MAYLWRLFGGEEQEENALFEVTHRRCLYVTLPDAGRARDRADGSHEDALSQGLRWALWGLF